MFHGANGDNTGVIAACWYGAMYGYHGVPEGNFKVSLFKCYVILKSVEYLFSEYTTLVFFLQNVEYHGRLVEQGRLLYELVYGSHDEENVSTVMNN